MSRHLTTNLKLPYYDGDDPPDGAAQQQDLAQTLDAAIGMGGVPPVGVMFMWPAPVAPSGYLLMQGQLVDAATYPQLAAMFGQDAQGKVTIPDMRDRFPVGAGSSYALHALGGAATVQLTDRQSGMRAHNHGGATFSADRSLNHLHGIGASAVNLANGGGAGSWMRQVDVSEPQATTTHSGGGVDHTHGIYGETASGALDAHENRPPYRAVNFIIRAG